MEQPLSSGGVKKGMGERMIRETSLMFKHLHERDS